MLIIEDLERREDSCAPTGILELRWSAALGLKAENLARDCQVLASQLQQLKPNGLSSGIGG